jgi:hypothetical protein
LAALVAFDSGEGCDGDSPPFPDQRKNAGGYPERQVGESASPRLDARSIAIQNETFVTKQGESRLCQSSKSLRAHRAMRIDPSGAQICTKFRRQSSTCPPRQWWRSTPANRRRGYRKRIQQMRVLRSTMWQQRWKCDACAVPTGPGGLTDPNALAPAAWSLGKTANCQSLVSLTLASREVPVMVGLRLFLPESWTSDPQRMTQARVPEDRQVVLSKSEIAIEEIDRVIASGVRFGCVLADSGYGSSGPFRQALSARGLLWAVGLSRRQNVYPAGVALMFPVAKAGKPRKYHVPEQPPVSAEAALAEAKWQKVSWRRGKKGRLTCLFAARRVHVADGHKHRMR